MLNHVIYVTKSTKKEMPEHGITVMQLENTEDLLMLTVIYHID